MMDSFRSVVLNRPFDKRLTTGRIHHSMFDVGRSMLTVRRRRVQRSLVSFFWSDWPFFWPEVAFVWNYMEWRM